MKVGVLTSGVNQDLERALSIIHNDGFRYAEIQFAWGVEDGHYSQEQLGEIKRLLDQYGMRCTAIMKNLFSGLRLDETTQGSGAYCESLRVLRETIRQARELGCNLTRVNSFDRHHVIFGYGGAQNHLSGGNAAWRHYLHLMEPVCRIAEDEGIDVMIETGTGGFIFSAALAKRAIDEFRCPRLKVLWDPANCLYNGEEPIPRAYELVREHLAEVHIKDLRFNRVQGEVTYCPVGRGSMAPYLKCLARMLREDCFAGAVVLENQVTPTVGTEEDGYRLSMRPFRECFLEESALYKEA